jgi:hypothetical protein
MNRSGLPWKNIYLVVQCVEQRVWCMKRLSMLGSDAQGFDKECYPEGRLYFHEGDESGFIAEKDA